MKTHPDWLLIVGTLLVGIGIWLAWREARFLRGSDVSSGRVVELVKTPRSSHGVTLKPKIAYRTPKGKKAEFVRSHGTNPAGLNVGETVLMATHRADRTVKIATFGHRFGGTLVLLLAGGSCLMMRLGLALGERYFKPGSSLFPNIGPPP